MSKTIFHVSGLAFVAPAYRSLRRAGIYQAHLIVALLTREFFKLISLALFFGVPLAWLTMNRWLQEFAYRIDLSFWIFILGGLTLAFIAFLTIFFQTINAAKADPIKSLKTE